MSVKVAIASSDGTQVDLHFGKAHEFLIFELTNGTFRQTETRTVPSVQTDEDDAVSFGCGSGNGCGSGSGCGGCGGSASGPLAPSVQLLLDCRAIVAAQIGGNIRRQFERNAISCFDIELSVEEALQKLAAYYTKFGE